MPLYKVVHRTSYAYESEVTSSYGEVHLLPRDLPHQRCGASSLAISPSPSETRERQDWFGNRTAFFALLDPHEHLEVVATSTVAVSDPGPLRLTAAWDDVVGAVPPDVVEYALDSPLVAVSPALDELARPSFPAGRTVVEAVADLTSRIHATFAYKPGATTVTTTIDEVLTAHEGVCQDFAHVLIGCLRSVGLPARYVSGYLDTDPPPGQPKLTGADESHAWASVWAGEAGWLDVDPTNDRFADDRHITTAWGRDYSDLPPLKGVIYTDGTEHELIVSVDVTRQG